MAQHDYVIDNSTGANVRSDINNALLAISSNNSGSSAPSTTYALQSFANTTDSMLQLRNAANNAFVNLRKFDGTLPLPDGSVSSPSLFFDDDINTGIFSSAADTFNVATGGVERMELGATTIFNEDGADVDFRIEGDTEANLFYVDAGNDRIGICTSSPAHKLHVADATTPELVVEDTTNNVKAVLGADNDVARIGSDSNHPMTLRVNDSEKARIHTTGEFSLATTSKNLQGGGASDFYINVTANTGSNHNGMVIDGLASAFSAFNTKPSSNHQYFAAFYLNSAGSDVGNISCSNSATTFNTSSDYRLKENVVSLSDGITRLKQLLPKRFNWIIDETNTLQDGFLAHEVSSLVPEAVTGEKDAIATEDGGQYSKGDPIYQTIDHSKLVPLLVAAVQELIAKVEALEAA